jgi:predicted MFS family arabinose efflux permease
VLLRSPILAARDGRLFLGAQAVDALAIGVAQVALPWLVLQNGGTHTEAGLIYSATVIPYVVFGLVAGSVGDRFPRRTVMLFGHAAETAFAAIIPIWAVTGAPPVGVVLAAAFGVGTGRVFVDAAAFGAVASIVGAEHFVEGQSALSAAWSIGFFGGPVLGGALVAAIGPGEALAAEAIAVALATLMVAAIRTSFAHASEDGDRATTIREGLRYMIRNRGIATYTVVGMAFAFASAGSFALLVPLLRDGVGLGSGAVGTILTLGSLAFLAASVLASATTRRYGGGVVMAAVLLANPFAIAVLGVAGAFVPALVGVLLYELTAGLISVVSIGERQRRAPARLQARVGIAGRMILLGTIAAGAALASALTASLGVGHLYLVMGAASLVVGMCSAPFVLRLDD